MKTWATLFLSLFFGLIFGFGLVVSGMINTANVIGFLDITGDWKEALAFVIGGAVVVAFPLFQWAKRRGLSLTGNGLETPPQKVDFRLIFGAAIFGIGWGLSGICPGPAIVWLGINPAKILPFIAAVIAGSILADLFRAKA